MSAHGSLAERFDRYVHPEPNSGCWLWTAAIRGGGYGTINAGGKLGRRLMAHRVSYEIHVGQIPEGRVLDHKCRMKCCVNPAHLEAVTQRENTLRGIGPTALLAAQTHCKRGHDLSDAYAYRGRMRHCRICQSMRAKAYRERKRK